MGIIKGLRTFRNEFFKEIGDNRLKRILILSFVVATIWILADLIGGNYDPNYWHDLICLLIGIVGERLIPWGKVAHSEVELLKEYKNKHN